jgi:hypothetical protein
VDRSAAGHRIDALICLVCGTLAGMHRLASAVLLVAAVMACDSSSEPSTTPEPSPTDGAVESAPDPEPEPEPEPEPAPQEEPEVTSLSEPVLSQDGFEARNLQCSFGVPTRGAAGFIVAGLVDPEVVGLLDACAPKGAAVEVSWGYVSAHARNVSVVAENSKMAKCVMTAMDKVRAGVDATCTAIILIGDDAGAAAKFEAR